MSTEKYIYDIKDPINLNIHQIEAAKYLMEPTQNDLLGGEWNVVIECG